MANAFLSVDLRAGGSWGLSQTRYLHRELNRRSPVSTSSVELRFLSDFRALTQRVRKYNSVPVLRLVPSDRPLFFCDNCCSANFYLPICLWCKWTSAAAMKSFEEKAPRARTMSTPKSCLAGPQRKSNLKAGLRGGMVPENLDPRGSPDTDRSTEPPETPRSVYQDYDSSGITAMDEWVKISVDEVTWVCRIDSPELPCTFDLMHCCGLPPYSQPAPPTQLSCDPYHGGRVRSKKRLSTINVDNNHGSIASLNRSVHTPRSDDGQAYESRSFFSDDELQGFRRSTDSRGSGTKSEGHVPRLAHNPIRTRNTAVQSLSPSPSFHRRPLYHYIRTKASDSQSTFDCGAVPEIPPKRSVTPQHGAGHLSQRPMSPACTDERSRSPLVPSIASFSRKGFSLSGETEQRMDLARVIHDGRFIFHESKPPRKRDRIMRGLRRSFKSFFSNKADR